MVGESKTDRGIKGMPEKGGRSIVDLAESTNERATHVR